MGVWLAAAIYGMALLLAFPESASRAGDLPGEKELQRAADSAMVGRSGSLVVVDVLSRKVLAAHRIDLAAQTVASPGSTLKPFVLLDLLEQGRLDPEQRLICRHQLRIGSVQMDCSHPISITQLTAQDAIAYSCNSYVAEVGPRLGAKEVLEVFRRAGLDSPTGLAPGEAVGRIDLPGNREQLQLEVLGDRGIEVTPLELLEAYRKLAERRRAGAQGSAAAVFAGLEESVSFGMAHAANVKSMKAAGKTGTAGSHGVSATHGFFAGYAPSDKPRVAMVVYLEHGRGMDAAALAQPVLAEIARRLQESLQKPLRKP